MNDNKGIWEWAKEAAITNEFKPFSIEDLNEFKNLLNNEPVRPFTFYAGQLHFDYQEALRTNDTNRLNELNAEVFQNKIDKMIKISNAIGVDYDIIFMLCNKYSYTERRNNEVCWSVLTDYIDEYEDRSFDLIIGNNRCDLVEEISYGWNCEEVSRKEIKDLFDELIIKDIEL